MTTDVTGSFRGGIGRVAGVLDWQSLEDIRLAGQGLISQTFDRQLIQSGFLTVNGTIYFAMIPLRAGQVVTNLSIYCTTTASGITTSKVGLYKKDGTRLGISADQGTSWQTAGLKTIALTSAYTAPTTDVYFAAIIAIASTTQPTLARSASSAGVAPVVGSGSAVAYTQTSQTDLIASATFAAGSAAIWFGAS